MNLNEFLVKLSATPRDWFVDRVGRIRRPMPGVLPPPRESSMGAVSWCDYQCPISSVGDRPTHAFCTVADGLGMPDELQVDIWRAADNCALRNSQTRSLILKACGLGYES